MEKKVNIDLFVDNEQYIYLGELGGDKTFTIPDSLVERYHLALLEWEAVQDELSDIFKGQ